MTKKHPLSVPRGDTFGASFDAEIHPATSLSPADLAARMERGFSVTKASDKPVAPKKKIIKGNIKVPTNAKMPTAAQVDDMLAPAKKIVRKLPKPPTPVKKRRPTLLGRDDTGIRREGELFAVEPIDMREIERRAALAKIVNRRVPKHMREQFLQRLKANQDKIAEFMFLEIATFDLAVPAALEIAGEYLNDSTDAGPSIDLGRVQKMLPYLAEIKTLEFLCKLTGLNRAHVEMLLRHMVDPEKPAPVNPMQALTKLLAANRAAPQQPVRQTREQLRQVRDAAAADRALLQALRGRK